MLKDVGISEVIAIDAPLLPTAAGRVRVCEQVFASGMFQRRCKAGFSHVPGTGQALRAAGHAAAEQFGKVAAVTESANFPRVVRSSNVVEAFPNAFLGVCLSEDTYGRMPRLRRGRKFDWLYDQWCIEGRFAELVGVLSDHLPATFAAQCENEDDHEHRAALICVATAACVAANRYCAVGDEHGGYFFLPPWTLWSEWSRGGLGAASRRFAGLQVWRDGKVDDVKTPK
ncbi:MAG: hypothetical protein U0164_03765 [Gemmatimonadaceae bacterium]